jgi:hypothetical protein
MSDDDAWFYRLRVSDYAGRTGLQHPGEAVEAVWELTAIDAASSYAWAELVSVPAATQAAN